MDNILPKYPTYKPSGVEWLREIPEHWELTRLGTRFEERRTKVSDKDYVPLSVTKNGTIPQLESAAKSNDGDNRKLVKNGDFVINSRSDRKGSSGISDRDGSVSLIYIVLEPKDIHPIYCNFLLKSYNFIEEFYRMGHGIVADLWTTRYDEMKSIMVGIPSFSEQTAIAAFLDHKTALIDKAIGIKEKQIELLKERRQILIHKAVTKGIGSLSGAETTNVKMKDSGVEWIGEIPEHWAVKRAKYLFDEINDRSGTGDEELLSVSHITGVTPRSEKNVTMFQSEDYSNSKLCQKGDLIFNIMWAWMGALGVSDRNGIVSPSYAIYRQKDKKFDSWYIENLLRSVNYVAHYNRVSTGLHSSRLRFYSTMFFEMAIGYPPLTEQEEIVTYLKTVEYKISTALSLKQQEIERLKEYKAILINGVVTGKIKVG